MKWEWDLPKLSKYDREYQEQMIPINGGYQYVHKISGYDWFGGKQIVCWLFSV